MKKFIPLMLVSFLLLNSFTETYANTNNTSEKTKTESLNSNHDPKPDSKNKTELVLANDAKFILDLLSKSLKGSDLIPEPIDDNSIRIPATFEPNIEHGILLDLECNGVSRLDVKLFNNWGVQVAECKYQNKQKNKRAISSTKKIRLSNTGNNGVKFNHELKEGNYYYSIEIYNNAGEKQTREGEIKLLRTERK